MKINGFCDVFSQFNNYINKVHLFKHYTFEILNGVFVKVLKKTTQDCVAFFIKI